MPPKKKKTKIKTKPKAQVQEVSPLSEKQMIVLDTYRRSYNVSYACIEGGISRQTFYDWKRDISAFNEHVFNTDEALKDNLKSATVKGAMDGNFPAQKFLLEKLAPERGFAPDGINIALIGDMTINPDIRRLSEDELNEYAVQAVERKNKGDD